VIELHKISLSRGAKLLLEQTSMVINPGEKVGLIGSNGTGKSSLLSLLRGELKEEGGVVGIPTHWRISSVLQDVEQSDKTALEYVLEGDDRFFKVQTALTQAEIDNDCLQLIALHEEMAIIDGYRAPAKAAELLYGLAFTSDQQGMATKSFSGGWQMRLNLARALMKPCDLLLLDEPTNHLDMDAIYWLERWLERFDGTLLVIAHDSIFLDKVVNKIACVEHKKLSVHKGNYTDFMKWRAEQLAQQQKFFEKQQQKIQHLQSFISRFKAKASKAKQAQSRMKSLSRMELVASVQADSEFQFTLSASENCPNPVIHLTDVSLGYNDHAILENISLHLAPTDRIGLLGVNGAGKSTFIKALAGELAPLAGTVTISPKLKVGYFNQHQVEALNLSETPFWHLKQIAPRLEQQAIRSFLGGFGFQGDQAFESVGVFSGGEKSRLVLALLAYQRPHLLLLDEPTNHLDLEMREALALALQSFEGAVIVVSHDRQLLGSVVDQFWLVAHGKIEPYDDDLDAYAQWIFAQRKKKASENTIQSRSQFSTTQSKTPSPSDAELRELEKKIKKNQENITILSGKLEGLSYKDPQSAQLYAQKNNLEKELATYEDRWLDLQT